MLPHSIPTGGETQENHDKSQQRAGSPPGGKGSGDGRSPQGELINAHSSERNENGGTCARVALRRGSRPPSPEMRPRPTAQAWTPGVADDGGAVGERTRRRRRRWSWPAARRSGRDRPSCPGARGVGLVPSEIPGDVPGHARSYQSCRTLVSTPSYRQDRGQHGRSFSRRVKAPPPVPLKQLPAVAKHERGQLAAARGEGLAVFPIFVAPSGRGRDAVPGGLRSLPRSRCLGVTVTANGPGWSASKEWTPLNAALQCVRDRRRGVGIPGQKALGQGQVHACPADRAWRTPPGMPLGVIRPSQLMRRGATPSAAPRW